MGGGEDIRGKQKRQRDVRQRTRRIHQGWTLYMKFGILLVFLGLLVLIRATVTATVQASRWEALLPSTNNSTKPIDPIRGNIYSDTDAPFAISVPRYQVALDLGSASLDKGAFRSGVDQLAKDLSELFGDKSAASYKQGLEKAFNKGDRYYRFVRREISYTELQKLMELPYFKGRKTRFESGLTYVKNTRREHPYGGLAFRTIGRIMDEPDSTGMTHGNSGLEMRFDSLMCGVPGVNRYVRIPPNNVAVEEKPAINGMDVYSTLNINIQDIAEKALRKKLIEVNADWGCVVVMEVETGAIKALSNLDRFGEGRYFEETNHAVADLLEPASTFKAFSMLAVLDNEGINPTDTVDVGNGLLRVGRGLWVKDHNFRKGGYGKITYNEAMYFSSNIGVVKAVFETFGDDHQAYLDQLNKMNIFDQMDLEIPGTSYPRFKQDVSTWSASTMPWSAHGYEINFPPIYILRFYNAIANGGKMMEPYIVRSVRRGEEVGYEREPKVINKQIASDKAIEQMQHMLRGVVTIGTGKAMNSPYVSIAGKTGTAQIQNAGGGHNVFFCGYFPSEKPLYSCIVVVSRPRGIYPAGSIPGAVLREIAEKTIATSYTRELEEVRPDSLATFGLRVLGGESKAVKQAVKYTDAEVDIHNDGEEWLIRQGGDSLQYLQGGKPVVGVMPNLVGMSAMDALYLAERMRLSVRLTGKGGVVARQSIRDGVGIREGQQLLLTLRN